MSPSDKMSVYKVSDTQGTSEAFGPLVTHTCLQPPTRFIFFFFVSLCFSLQFGCYRSHLSFLVSRLSFPDFLLSFGLSYFAKYHNLSFLFPMRPKFACCINMELIRLLTMRERGISVVCGNMPPHSE